MLCFLFGTGIAVLIKALETSFTSYLLQEDFGVEDEDIGAILGEIGLVAEICTIVIVFFMGFILDIFGRKWPYVIGMATAGVCFISMPLPPHIRGLYFLRSLASMGLITIMSSPLQVDYFYRD